MPKMREYALYKGDTLLSVGTIPEISKEQNVKVKTLYFYMSPSQKKRCKNGRVLIRLEDDEDE